MKTQYVEFQQFERECESSVLLKLSTRQHFVKFKDPHELAFFWYESGEGDDAEDGYDGAVYFGIYNPKTKFKKIGYITEKFLRETIKVRGKKYYIDKTRQGFDFVVLNIYKYYSIFTLQILGVRLNVKPPKAPRITEYLTHKKESIRLAAKRVLES